MLEEINKAVPYHTELLSHFKIIYGFWTDWFFFTVCTQNTLLAPCELLVLTKIRDKQR